MRTLRAHGVPLLCLHAGQALILAAFVVLGIIYLQVTPLLETPDEPSHFSVVKHIADERRLPPARPAPPDMPDVPVILPGPPVYYAPPLYYALGAPLITGLDTAGFADAVVPNPNWARGWAPTPGRSPENKHIYVHTADQRPPRAGWAVAMRRLRAFSLLWGTVTVSGVHTLARTLWPRSNWALAATALVAFNPAFLFVTTGVTNDALLFALSAWAFALMARMIKSVKSPTVGIAHRHCVRSAPGTGRPDKWVQVLSQKNAPRNDSSGIAGDAQPSGARFGLTVGALGVIMGLAALTKQSALAFMPAAALAVLWGARARAHTWRATFKWLCLWGALVALVAGWWYLHNTLTYHDPLGFEPHQPPTEDWRPPLTLMLRQLGQALQGYWGAFGWGLILVDPTIYGLSAIFAGVGLLGLLRRPGFTAPSAWLRRGWHNVSQPSPSPQATRRRIVILLGLGLCLNLIGLGLWLWRTSAPYGRLLFPTLGPLAVWLTLGWQRWLGPSRARHFAWAVALVMGLYAVLVPWRYLQPAYASPVVSSVSAENAPALDVQFDGRLQLLSGSIQPERVQPGEMATLTLYWQALQPLTEDLTVFVQLAPRDPEQRVAGLDEYLGSTRYPTSAWQVGEVIQQTHQVRLPDDVQTPTLYWFTVGLYDEPGSEPWPVMADGSAVPNRVIRLGPLRVLTPVALQAQVLAPPHRLGTAIRVAGYDLNLGSDTLSVTLHWQAEDTPQEDLIAFVHMLDPAGNLVAQDDRRPRQEEYPTWAWQAGDHVPDVHLLRLPTHLTPGRYRLVAGLYHSQDGARLAVWDADGNRMPDDVVPLGAVTWPPPTTEDERE